MRFKLCLKLSLFVVFPTIPLNISWAQVVSPPRAEKLETNALLMHKAPPWLKRTRVEKVTDRIQTKLEWTIRKIQVYWYTTPEEFRQVNRMSNAVVAFARRQDNSIHIGPEVNERNFDAIFAHELVHIISYQKYKGAIPKWLEEGMANHLSRQSKLDYKWLSLQTLPVDVRKMDHPFSGTGQDFRLTYAISQALIEMIDAKCDLERLVQLSVERGMEPYLKTYCEILDLNQALSAWIKKKATI